MHGRNAVISRLPPVRKTELDAASVTRQEFVRPCEPLSAMPKPKTTTRKAPSQKPKPTTSSSLSARRLLPSLGRVIMQHPPLKDTSTASHKEHRRKRTKRTKKKKKKKNCLSNPLRCFTFTLPAAPSGFSRCSEDHLPICWTRATAAEPSVAAIN